MITEIVTQPSTKNRIAILQKMIRIGEALLKLNNMNGAYKVYKALSSPGVARLQKTWKVIIIGNMLLINRGYLRMRWRYGNRLK
jgi:Ras-specific guanine nucleotide-releasing factor 1